MQYYNNFNKIFKLDPDSPGMRGQIIKDIIESSKVEDTKAKASWGRYKQELAYLKIDQKTKKITSKSNNKAHHAFRSEIANAHTNYLLGIPISYDLTGEDITDEQRQRFDSFIQNNYFEHLDNNLGIRLATQGKAYRLLYQNQKNLWALNFHRWECKVVLDENTGEVLYAIRYYDVVDRYDATRRKTHVEFYDNKYVEYYSEAENGEYYTDVANLGLDDTKKPHGFDKVPIIEFKNDDIAHTDYESVENLIDIYDKVESLNIDDIEELRDAYLFIKGMNLTQEQMENMAESNLLITLQELADAKFLTKNINPEYLDRSIKRLEHNIYRLSQTVDYTDKDFGNTASGISLRYKLTAMTARMTLKKNNYILGLKKQYRVLATGWQMLASVTIDPNKIKMNFTPNMPIDFEYWSKVAQGFTGILSKATILDMLPSTIVANTQGELDRLQQEEDAYIQRLPSPSQMDEEK